MMRVICLLLVSLFALKVNAQQYTKFNGYGFQADRIKSDSISIHPSDTIRNKAARSIAVLNGVFYIADGTKWKASGTSIDTTRLVKYTDTAAMLTPYSKLKSVGLLMPPAFLTANSPLTSNGIIAVSMGGLASQYLRGDGQLATLPSSSSGGSAVSYYLNGGTSQGTIGGSIYYQMSKTAVLGTGVDFSTTGNGLLTQFITDAADPNRLEIPAGNWNFEMYFNISSSGGNTAFYVELLKYNGSGFTSIASNIGTPEEITGGTAIDVYLTSLAIPYTTLTTSDRLALRVYIVNNSLGRTVSLHTQDSHLCQVITNFAGGVSALNGLTANTQYFATGTSGTDFNISSVTATHTFNLPTASATNRGALSTTDWSSFNGKLGASDTATMLNPYSRGSGTNGQVAYWNATRSLTGSSGFTYTPTSSLLLNNSVTAASAIARGQNITSTLTAAANNDVLVGLDVNPTFTNGAFTGVSNIGLRVKGNSLLYLNQDAFTGFEISNTTSSANAYSALVITAGTGSISFGKYSASKTAYKTIASNDGYFYTGSSGGNDMSFLADLSTSNIKFSAGGSSTAHLRIFSNGNIGINQNTDASYKLDVNGTARVSGTTSIIRNNGTSAGSLLIQNTSTTGANNIQIGEDFSTNYMGFGWYPSAASIYRSLTPKTAYLYALSGASKISFNTTTNTQPITFATDDWTERMRIFGGGNIIIGGGNTPTDVASALLNVTSTTQGFLPPRMTTAQRDLIATPAAGLIIYNTSTNKHQGYNGSIWNDFY